MHSRAWVVRLAVLLSSALFCSGIWWTLPRWRLWSGIRAMARLEAESPTTDFQWPGAPAPSGKRWTAAEIASENAEITEQLERAEARLGVTADTASLRGRLAVRAKAYDEAIRQMDLARLLDADGANPRRLVEWGLAYGVRGRAENRAYDVMLGLDKLLRARETGKFGPGEFEDLALLAGDIPAPSASSGFWKEALQRADARDKSRLGKALAGEREIIDGRQRRINQVLGTRRASRDIPGSTELLLQVALAEWIGDREHHEEDLRALAAAFLDIHRDPVVRDLIGMPSSREAERALMAAAAANRAGEYSKAVESGALAQKLFQHSRNFAAGVLAANEWYYGRLRTADHMDCTQPWVGTASGHGYRIAVLRARFEENSCRSKGEREDVVPRRYALAVDAAVSGYPLFSNRALSALVEPFHGATSPAASWSAGHIGMVEFWRVVGPAAIGANFYSVLAESTVPIDSVRVGVVLAEDLLVFIRDSPNRKIIESSAELLAELKLQVGHPTTPLGPVESAEAALRSGHPDQSLEILSKVTGGTEKFPYSHSEAHATMAMMPVLSRVLHRLGRIDEARKHVELCTNSAEANLKGIDYQVQREATLREYAACWTTLAQEHLDGGDDLRALETWQRFRSLGRQNAWQMPSPRPGESWVSIAKLPSGWVVWLLDQGGVRGHRLGSVDLDAPASRFSALAATELSPQSELNSAGESLARELWGPLRQRIEAAQLVVVDAPGALALVPWAALPRSDGQPLSSHSASIQTVGWGRAVHRLPNAAARPVFVHNPATVASAGFGFPALPDAGDQLAQFGRIWPHAEILRGPFATHSGVERALKSANIFHFFGHGIAFGGSAGLVLSKPGSGWEFMTAAEISRLDLGQLDLAVLTACSSGATQTPGAVNMESLSEAFLSAGASQVMASRWDLDSNSTSSLLTAFYRELDQHGDRSATPEALRRAMYAERLKRPHPRYWAGVQLYGAP